MIWFDLTCLLRVHNQTPWRQYFQRAQKIPKLLISWLIWVFVFEWSQQQMLDLVSSKIYFAAPKSCLSTSLLRFFVIADDAWLKLMEHLHIPPTSINIKVFKPTEGMLHGRLRHCWTVRSDEDWAQVQDVPIVVGASFSFCGCHFGLSCPSHKPWYGVVFWIIVILWIDIQIRFFESYQLTNLHIVASRWRSAASRSAASDTESLTSIVSPMSQLIIYVCQFFRWKLFQQKCLHMRMSSSAQSDFIWFDFGAFFGELRNYSSICSIAEFWIAIFTKLWSTDRFSVSPSDKKSASTSHDFKVNKNTFHRWQTFVT